MKIKHIILTLAVVAAAVYAYSAIAKKKKTQVIKDRGFEIEIEQEDE